MSGSEYRDILRNLSNCLDNLRTEDSLEISDRVGKTIESIEKKQDPRDREFVNKIDFVKDVSQMTWYNFTPKKTDEFHQFNVFFNDQILCWIDYKKEKDHLLVHFYYNKSVIEYREHKFVRYEEEFLMHMFYVFSIFIVTKYPDYKTLPVFLPPGYYSKVHKYSVNKVGALDFYENEENRKIKEFKYDIFKDYTFQYYIDACTFGDQYFFNVYVDLIHFYTTITDLFYYRRTFDLNDTNDSTQRTLLFILPLEYQIIEKGYFRCTSLKAIHEDIPLFYGQITDTSLKDISTR